MERRRTRRWYSAEQWSLDQLVKLVAKCDCLVIWLQLYSEFANIAGGQTNRNNFGLSFGLKKGLRFHFYSGTCLNYTFLNIFLVQGNLKPKLRGFFKPKTQANTFLLNLGSRPANAAPVMWTIGGLRLPVTTVSVARRWGDIAARHLKRQQINAATPRPPATRTSVARQPEKLATAPARQVCKGVIGFGWPVNIWAVHANPTPNIHFFNQLLAIDWK